LYANLTGNWPTGPPPTGREMAAFSLFSGRTLKYPRERSEMYCRITKSLGAMYYPISKGVEYTGPRENELPGRVNYP